MTVRSMTGYGTAEGALGPDRLTVELRSVNHRFFNPTFKLPSMLVRWEREARELMRARVARGHVTLSARLGADAVSTLRIDADRFTAYLEELRSLAARHGIAAPVDVATVLRLPGVVTSNEPAAEVDDPTAFLAVVERAVDALNTMRAGEGTAITTMLLDRLGVMEQAMGAISVRAPERVVAQRDRLRASVRELLDGAVPDEQRLAQEIAILADRLDVAEEIDRFGAHVAAFRATLASPPAEGVGKRLGFLIQEMLREANTTGSKANDAPMLQDVVAIKEELERIREQVENLE
jgi:uncharacterized protein (TIGR00255 family)